MENITSLKRKAKTTGLLYLLFALTSIYGYLIVQPRILVNGDVAATAKNMLAYETLYRTCVAAGLVTNALFVLVVLSLYRLLKGVNVHWAKMMVALVLIAVPVSLLSDVLKLTALQAVKGEALLAFSLPQAQDGAVTLLKMVGYGSQMICLFWGLWLLPLGLLVYQSGFIPRLFGILLWVNGAAYVISSFTFILLPGYQSTVSKLMYPAYFAGEVPLIFWLVIKGVKDHLSISVVSETETILKTTMGKLKTPFQQ